MNMYNYIYIYIYTHMCSNNSNSGLGLGRGGRRASGTPRGERATPARGDIVVYTILYHIIS